INETGRKLQGANDEGVACRHISSHTDDRSSAECDEEGDEWRELRSQASGAQSCRPALTDAASKTHILAFLARENFDYGEGIDVLGGYVRHLPSCLCLPFCRCLDVPCIVNYEHEEGRGQSEGENWGWYAVEQHDRGNTDDGQDAYQQVNQAIRDEFLDVGNVARDALDQVTLLLLAMPVQRDALQVFKELLA